MKCPACGFKNSGEGYIKLESARGESDWKKCEACDSFFLIESYNPEVEAEHSKITSHGNKERGEFMNKFKAKMFKNILKLIKKENPFSKKLLDIGCSYGGFLFFAKSEGYYVTGTDILGDAVDYVKRKGIDARECYSLKECVFDNEFDIITALDCNYYWNDQADEIKSINRLLTPDGLYVVRTSDKTIFLKLGMFLRKLSGSIGSKIIRRSLNDHRFSMPISSMKNLLWSRGFELINVSVLDAVHSNETSFSVKLSFWVGAVLYKTTGIFLAPGAVLVFKKVRQSL